MGNIIFVKAFIFSKLIMCSMKNKCKGHMLLKKWLNSKSKQILYGPWNTNRLVWLGSVYGA